jgi:hypothetical protein
MRQSVGDMVRSMGIVLAVVFVVVLVSWRALPEAVKEVDVTPVLTQASAQAQFSVKSPAALPEAWRPTSARWEPTQGSAGEPVLHIGYVTPAEQYAQVTQSVATGPVYLAEQTAQGVPEGEVVIDDVTWQQYRGRSRTSLVRSGDGVTTVVSGSAGLDELGILAASLR